MIFCEAGEEINEKTGHIPATLLASLKREGFVVLIQKDYDKMLKRIAELENELLNHGHRDIVRTSEW